MWNNPESQIRVLVVDDSAIICGRLLTLLSDVDGVDIIGFSQTADDACERIRSLRPDVVILDIRMPGGSGIDALRRIKRDFPETVVIMFTNYPYAPYSDLCKAAGAEYFFDKTTEFHCIPDVLSELVSSRIARQTAAREADELLPFGKQA